MIEYVQIYLAIVAILGSLVIAYKRSVRRNSHMAAIDIGVWWLAFLALYSIQPTLYWLVTGEFLSVASNRLEKLGTTASDIAVILTISACYATAFVLTYLRITRSARFQGAPLFAKIRNNVFIPTAILFIILWLVMQGLFSEIGAGDGYESRFLNLSESSLGMRRLHKFSQAFLIISGIVVIVAMLQRPKTRIFTVIAIPVLVLMVASLGGSRGPAFMLALVFLISWHALVRPIPRMAWGTFALFGILAFNLLGAMRSYERLPDASELLPWLVASGEFEHVFGNAVELLHAVRDERLLLPYTIRFAEFLAFLPSELLIFEKTSLSDWFMDAFYPDLKATGGGLAFGAMAQAVIGGGAVEALLRGATFGAVLGVFYQILVKYSGHWWAFPAYIYILIRIFDAVRSTTFSFLSDFIQVLVPLIVFLGVFSQFIHRRQVSSGEPLKNFHNAPDIQQSSTSKRVTENSI